MCNIAQNMMEEYLLHSDQFPIPSHPSSEYTHSLSSSSAYSPVSSLTLQKQKEKRQQILQFLYSNEAVNALEELARRVKVVELLDVGELKKWAENEMETQIINNNISLLVIDSVTSSLVFFELVLLLFIFIFIFILI